MRVQKLPNRFILITFCLAIVSLTFSFQFTQAQTKPLTLGQVLTGLQSTSGGFTLPQKNKFIIDQVLEKGVTFNLTPELERELRTAGASAILIRTIRLKTRNTGPTPVSNVDPEETKPNATYERIWVEQDIVEKGIRGIQIYANFSVYNLKNVKSDIVYRFKKDGDLLKGKTTTYKTSSGDLSARRYFTPTYSATVYEEVKAFVPYSEFDLSPGLHRILMEAFVIKRDGTTIKKLTSQNVNLIIPSPTIRRSAGSATLTKMWVDYKLKENGVWGMRVHVKMSVKNLMDQRAYLQILFTKEDGTPLKGQTTKYRSSDGQTVILVPLRPKFTNTAYNDLSRFIPYSEFGLPVGKYNLKMHADIVSSKYEQISHLKYLPFSYNREK